MGEQGGGCAEVSYYLFLLTILYCPNVNLTSSSGLLSSGQLPLAIRFITRHPDALWNVIYLSLSATIGEGGRSQYPLGRHWGIHRKALGDSKYGVRIAGALFISYTIKTFGSLIFATIMTTRQFLSILLSCLLFAHPLSLGQW